MPPRIAVRFAWASRQGAQPSSSYICARAFSSTQPAQALGPHSPNYIDFPKPLQPSFPPKPRIKGVLPAPRHVFKTRSPIPKYTDEFVMNSTPDPAKKGKIIPRYGQDAQYREYKKSLSEARRKALRRGISELHKRHTETEAKEKTDREAFFADKRARATAPPRDVDVLTENSVSKSIRDFLEDKLPSTSRSNISDARRRAFERKMAKHAAVRQARLHDLYVNAREFIVNEEQLDEAIEKAFGTEENPVQWDTQGREIERGPPGSMPQYGGASPWQGPIPEGVADKLQSLTGGEGVGLAKERIKKVAEAFTGGKM